MWHPHFPELFFVYANDENAVVESETVEEAAAEEVAEETAAETSAESEEAQATSDESASEENAASEDENTSENVESGQETADDPAAGSDENESGEEAGQDEETEEEKGPQDPLKDAVYLDPANGDDENTGAESYPVKTLENALKLAKESGLDLVYIVSTVDLTEDTVFDEDITIKRAETFEGTMINVKDGATLTINKAVIDGNKEEVKAKMSMINLESGAKLVINDGAVLQNNEVNNDEVQLSSGSYNDNQESLKQGGAISGDAGSDITMNGGIIENNRSYNGGGVKTCGDFIMNGGTIQNNEATFDGYKSTPKADVARGAGFGGGIYLRNGGKFVMNGGSINNNHAARVGGGISVGGKEIESVSGDQSTLYVHGGDISNNVADQRGGGIFLQINTYGKIDGTKSDVTISNNEAGTSWQNYYGFVGGGIYVNGSADSSKNGELDLEKVYIVGNKASLAGGGIACCPTSDLSIYLRDGSIITDNTGYDGDDPKNRPTIKYDVFVASEKTDIIDHHDGMPDVYLTSHFMGGFAANWMTFELDNYAGATPYKYADQVHQLELGNASNASERFYSNPDNKEAALAYAKENCKVFITDNTGYYHGGGVSCNGILNIGTYDVPEIEKYVNKESNSGTDKDGGVHTDLGSFDEVYTYDLQAYITNDAAYVEITDKLVEAIELVGQDDLKKNVKVTVKEGADPKTGEPAPKLSADGTDVTDSGDVDIAYDKDSNVLCVRIGSDNLKKIGTDEEEDALLPSEYLGHWVQVTFKAQIKEAYRSFDKIEDVDGIWTTVTDNAPIDDAKVDRNPGSTESEENHKGILNETEYTINKGFGLKNAYSDKSNTVTVKPQEPEKPEIEKYVNQAVHKNIKMDEEFPYDIIAYVTKDAEEVKIEDTLNEYLDFVSKATDITVEDLGEDNDHHVVYTVTGAIAGHSDATVTKSGTEVENAKVDITGKTLTVTIDDASANRGHWVKVHFVAKLAEGKTFDELQQKGYVTIKGDEAEDGRDKPNVGNAPVNAGATHTGVANYATYEIKVGNQAKYSDKSNTVTVKPEKPEEHDIEISKTDLGGTELPGAEMKLSDENGNELEKWTSDEKAKSLKLKAGKYILEEVVAPVGYQKVTTKIVFSVNSDGSVTVQTSAEEIDGEAVVVTEGSKITLKDAPVQKPEIEKYVNEADAEVTVIDETVHTDLSAFDQIFRYDIQAYITNDATHLEVTDALESVLEFVGTPDSVKVVVKAGEGDDGLTAPLLSKEGKKPDTEVNIDAKSWNRGILSLTMGSEEEDAEVLDEAGQWLHITFEAQIKENCRSIEALQKKGIWVTVIENDPIDEPDNNKGEKIEEHEGVVNDAKYTINRIGDIEDFKNTWMYEDTSNKVTVKPTTEELKVEKVWDIAGKNEWPSGATVTFGIFRTKDGETAAVQGAVDRNGKYKKANRDLTVNLTAGKPSMIISNLPTLTGVEYSAKEIAVNGQPVDYSTEEAGEIIIGVIKYVVEMARKVAEGADPVSFEATNTLKGINVKVSKTDLGGTELPGAEIKVSGRDGFKEEWTSTEEVHEMYLMPGGYEMVEVVAPEGYEKVTTVIEFSVDISGKVTLTTVAVDNGGEIEMIDSNHIVLKDAPAKIEIGTEATDKADGDHVIAAEENVTVVDTVSYTNLIVGRTYKVSGVLMDKETEKPLLVDGKEVTAEKEFEAKSRDGKIDIEFTFDASALKGKSLVAFERLYYDNKEVAAHTDITDVKQTVDVENPPEKTEVYFSKTDLEGKELPGAEMKLTDSEGNVIDTWTSTTEEHILKLEDGEYVLTEVAAPEGYNCVTTEMKFAVKNGEVELLTAEVDNGGQIILMTGNTIVLEDAPKVQEIYEKPKPEEGETPEPPTEVKEVSKVQSGTGSVNTGDGAAIYIWIAVLMAAICAASVAVIRRRKTN